MVTRAEEGGARTGAAARSWLRVLPGHAVHVEEGGDAAGLHSHQIAPNTCRETHRGTQTWHRKDREEAALFFVFYLWGPCLLPSLDRADADAALPPRAKRAKYDGRRQILHCFLGIF